MIFSWFCLILFFNLLWLNIFSMNEFKIFFEFKSGVIVEGYYDVFIGNIEL